MFELSDAQVEEGGCDLFARFGVGISQEGRENSVGEVKWKKVGESILLTRIPLAFHPINCEMLSTWHHS